MANTRSAAKRARQTVRRTVENRRVLTAIKTQLKKTRAAISSGNKEAAKAEVQKLSAVLDRAAKTGRIHRNAANRRKGSFARQLAALA